MAIEIERMWINQPSYLLPGHKWHGVNVFAYTSIDGTSARVYFLSGDVISMECPRSWLSEGWKGITNTPWHSASKRSKVLTMKMTMEVEPIGICPATNTSHRFEQSPGFGTLSAMGYFYIWRCNNCLALHVEQVVNGVPFATDINSPWQLPRLIVVS